MELKKLIREIENYPKEGISFKDLTTLFKDKDALKYMVDSIFEEFRFCQITKVVSLESRGFVLGGALAYKLDSGFIPARKPGKLPSSRITEEYQLEYGVDSFEIHTDSICEGDIVLIHDDLIATGGSAYAAYKLVKRLGAKQVFFSFICDLSFIENEIKEELTRLNYHYLVRY